jgi:hypothetical protein
MKTLPSALRLGYHSALRSFPLPSLIPPHPSVGFFVPSVVLTTTHRTDFTIVSYMNRLHDLHDNNSLDCLMTTAHITYQAVGRSGRMRYRKTQQ